MWERYGNAILVAAVVGIAALLLYRKPASMAPATPTGIAIDPQDTIGEMLPYFGRVPQLALLPAYIQAAVDDPWSQAPLGLEGPDGATADAGDSYTTYNQGGGTNPWSVALAQQTAGESHGGCGCGGGCGDCKPKCATTCDSRVRFTDGRGSCLQPENALPFEIGRWMEILSAPAVVPDQLNLPA